MKRFLITAAIVLSAGAAQAESPFSWNGSGFATSHSHWYDLPSSHPSAYEDYFAMPPTQREVDKAIADQKACKPIIMYTDAGIVRSKADGCRK